MFEVTYYCDKCGAKVEGKLGKIFLTNDKTMHLCEKCEKDFLTWLAEGKKGRRKGRKQIVTEESPKKIVMEDPEMENEKKIVTRGRKKKAENVDFTQAEEELATKEEIRELAEELFGI